MDKNVDKISISSSDGWNEIEFQLINYLEAIVVLILVKGKFWNRDQSFNIESAQLVEDFDAKFHQAILSKDKLILLKESLESWFIKPEEISLELSDTNPKISIFIGELDEFICSKLEPVFVLSYKDSRIETKIKFVIDQSCLTLMLEDLKKCLRKIT